MQNNNVACIFDVRIVRGTSKICGTRKAGEGAATDQQLVRLVHPNAVKLPPARH